MLLKDITENNMSPTRITGGYTHWQLKSLSILARIFHRFFIKKHESPPLQEGSHFIAKALCKSCDLHQGHVSRIGVMCSVSLEFVFFFSFFFTPKEYNNNNNNKK